jgi:hypothetical protein
MLVIESSVSLMQGIPQQQGSGQIACLNTSPPPYFVFKNENVKVKVKYGFVCILV